MDEKITLRFDKEVIQKAKCYSEAHGMSLSRLVEFLMRSIISSHYQAMEDFPIAGWVRQIAEGKAICQTKKRSRKAAKQAFYTSKK